MKLWALFIAAWLLAGCASALPPRGEPVPSFTIAARTDTRFGAIAAEAGIAGDSSGLQPLAESGGALEARLSLIRHASVSLDIQYYLIGNDGVGHLMLDELTRAAERGVRVRVLVDDLYTRPIDAPLRRLSAQANAQVRVFNPVASGRSSSLARLWQMATQFDRLNHRMHNKLFVADGAIAIVGGRNLADEYFLKSALANFIDFDMLVVGALLPPLTASFDTYWNSEISYPIEALGGGLPLAVELPSDPPPELPPELPVAIPDHDDRLGFPPLERQLASRRYGFLASRAGVVVDSPRKALALDTDHAATVLDGFLTLVAQAKSEVLIINPYFIPGPAGVERMREARRHGVQVVVVTNSLAATDEPLVHSGYARYRVDMLRAGVRLFEIADVRLKHDPAMRRLFGSSAGRLHAKLAIIDREMILVGSMNLDARSALTNTEIGIGFRSTELAARMQPLYDTDTAPGIYEVVLADDGKTLQWVAHDAEGDERTNEEPGATFVKRAKLLFYSLFVPESIL